MYKSASQHRRRLALPAHARGDAPSSRGGRADVGGAAAALRAGLDAGCPRTRAAALASPLEAAGAHAIWKLPSRALWDDLAPPPRRRARRRGDGRGATRRGHVPQRPTRAHLLHALRGGAVASIARLRTCLHQLIVDVVSTYNILTPLLGGGNMPPRASTRMPTPAARPNRCDDLRSTVTPPPPPPGANPPRENAEGKARRPKVRVVEFETNAVGGIHDEDWNWRLLRRAPASGARRPRRLRTRKRRGSTGRAAKTSARRCLGACGDSRPR